MGRMVSMDILNVLLAGSIVYNLRSRLFQGMLDVEFLDKGNSSLACR